MAVRRSCCYAPNLVAARGLWLLPDGSLLFTTGATITRLDAEGRFSTYLRDTAGVIGLAFDAKGRLIGARTEPAQILVLAPERAVLADAINDCRCFARMT